MAEVDQPLPYTAPPHATVMQKLGPGGLVSYLLAASSTVFLVGFPVIWRMRGVLLGAAGSRATEAADAILVLGRRLDGNSLTPVFEARLAHALGLWRKGIAPRIVVAGGITGRATLSEAEAGGRWLRARGFPAEALCIEARSQHTLENLFWVREHMRAEGWRTLTLVSDPLHLARACALAQGLGLSVSTSPAAAAPPRRGSLAWWRRALSESFLLHWYHTGVAYSRLIGSRKQLARIT